MKIIRPINQHFPIWSFLCGDHALKEKVKYINPKLIKQPDLLDPLENSIRLEVFRSTRNWIKKDMGEDCSFALAQIDVSDLDSFKSCFSEIMFNQLPKEYRDSYVEKRDFLLERKQKPDITKPKQSSIDEYDLVKKINKTYKKVTESMVLDTTFNNEQDISIALNRTFLMEESDGKITVMDGLHRLSAYYWSKVLEKNKKLPNKLYCYYWKANYKC